MSKYLGPIHYLMYEKIKFQDHVVSFLLKDETIFEELNQKIAPVSRKDLAKIVDETNIHGWLASCIDIVEIRLAYALKNADNVLVKLFEFGKMISENKNIKEIVDASALFNIINQYILDGMPCDFALDIESSSSDHLALVTLIDTHKQYYDNLFMIDPSLSLAKTCHGNHNHDEHETFKIKKPKSRVVGNSDNYSFYYQAREAFLKGLLCNSNWSLTQVSEGNFNFNKIQGENNG